MKRQTRYEIGAIVGAVGLLSTFAGFQYGMSTNFGYDHVYKKALAVECYLKNQQSLRNDLLLETNGATDVSSIDTTISALEGRFDNLLPTELMKETYGEYKTTRSLFPLLGVPMGFFVMLGYGCSSVARKLGEQESAKQGGVT